MEPGWDSLAWGEHVAMQSVGVSAHPQGASCSPPPGTALVPAAGAPPHHSMVVWHHGAVFKHAA